MNKVGIDDIELYVPPQKILLSQVVKYRSKNNRPLYRALSRSLQTTGQHAIRFPYQWEDTATMSAQSARSLLLRNSKILSALGYLAVGTETGLDHAKAAASFVLGMLLRSGIKIPKTLVTFQSQQACAGGTVALLSILALLAVSNQAMASGLVICSDIARYRPGSAAEITQGAGAASLLLNINPKLMEIDLGCIGSSSSDVDDFFRPLGQKYAQVQGTYSVQCYNEALSVAFENYCNLRGTPPKEVLDATDFFVMHNPFRNMAWNALSTLVQRHTNLSPEGVQDFLDTRSFKSSVDPTAEVGNIYSGSTYLAMAFLLWDRWKVLNNEIIGKKMLIFSYGSGNTMIVFSATLTQEAPAQIARWNIEAIQKEFTTSSIESYLAWTNHHEHSPIKYQAHAIPSHAYYLASVRKDGYREYAFKS